MRRLSVLALFLGGAAVHGAAYSADVPRIGYLEGRPSPVFDGFVQGLRDIGRGEGQSITIERRLAHGDLGGSRSRMIVSLGTGRETIKVHADKWARSEQGNTSRSIFNAFCDSLASGGDARSGGAPQLVGLYREGTGRTFGIVYQNKRFIQGLPALPTMNSSLVDWRDELFQRVDAQTLAPLPGAQRHARPRRL
jgi:hypothetical protein